ncbi:YihY/virulence factor BrkB family protein [Novosphingobium sp.]|uniref:YihY/virulence factor BrkB family protein n=1 Tax=Novosphingobium sp. TaxID=1874826 RepID=UPI003B5213E0
MSEKEVDRPGEPGGAGTDSVTLAGPPGAKAASDWALSPAQWNSVPSWKKVVLETWRKSGDDHIGLIAAGVAFYGFLAFVPLLAAIVLLYGLLADASTVVHDVQRMTSIMPPAAANLVGDQLMELVKTSDGKKGLGVLTALVIAMFGTVNCAGSIVTALNVACEVKETRGFIALYGLALGIATTAVLTAIGALILVAALVQVEEFLPGVSAAPLFLGKLIAYIALTLVGAAVATTLYRFGPSLGEENLGKADPRTWVWFTPGSVLASVSWLALTSGFGTYAAKIGHYNATYGSLSAVIIMLTWMYLSSYVLLFGAELNAELARKT